MTLINPKTFQKKEIVKISENACELLERGKEDEFFDQLELLLVFKNSFGKLRPLGQYMGKMGLNNPELYFNILDKFFRKDLNYGYRENLYNIEKMRMSKEEIQKSRVWGWRAGIVGLAFNEMSQDHPEKVIEKTREYVILSSHWSSSDTFADKTFNRIFEEHFDYIMGVLKEWALDENIWIRNTAAFAIHAPVERKILDREQFIDSLGVLDLVMEDSAKNVQKKAAWALRVVSKYYPDETYDFLVRWSNKGNKNTKWIIKNCVKFYDEERKNKLFGKN